MADSMQIEITDNSKETLEAMREAAFRALKKGSDVMKIKEFDTVLLKDGRKASIVEVLSDTAFIADVGSGPKDWETIDITLDMIEKVVWSGK